MLAALLKERFHLQFHREAKEMPVYALTIARNGIKFHESAPDAKFSANHGVHGRNQVITATKFTMGHLVAELARDPAVSRPVIDRTGLTGAYDIRLEATPQVRSNRDPEPEDIVVFTALREQLGLQLAPEKAPVDVVVVDHIEKPDGN